MGRMHSRVSDGLASRPMSTVVQMPLHAIAEDLRSLPADRPRGRDRLKLSRSPGTLVPPDEHADLRNGIRELDREPKYSRAGAERVASPHEELVGHVGGGGRIGRRSWTVFIPTAPSPSPDHRTADSPDGAPRPRRARRRACGQGLNRTNLRVGVIRRGHPALDHRKPPADQSNCDRRRAASGLGVGKWVHRGEPFDHILEPAWVGGRGLRLPSAVALVDQAVARLGVRELGRSGRGRRVKDGTGAGGEDGAVDGDGGRLPGRW